MPTTQTVDLGKYALVELYRVHPNGRYPSELGLVGKEHVFQILYEAHVAYQVFGQWFLSPLGVQFAEAEGLV